MLNISNIQHFSVGDGDGIRTTVFLKGCNLCCPWCHNPENLTPQPVVLHYKGKNQGEVMGRRVSLEEILPELLEDRDFYGESGGVTFSGGEAMLQAKELAELAALLKEEGISVLIDTAGCVPYRCFQTLNPLVAGYLFDFKTGDPGKYRMIGGDLALVTENIKALQKDSIPVTIRIPLIPGFNTDRDSVKEICTRLQDLGITEVDLLPFHRLGSAKYEAMGLEYAYKEQEPLTKQEIHEMKTIFETYFTVNFEG